MDNLIGTGIDMVSISEIKELNERTNGVFVKMTFTENEKAEAAASADEFEYLAGRFAVKEAVYKAVCGTHLEANFDFRKVETLRLSNGAPQVSLSEEIKRIFDQIGASNVLVSISNQGDFAIAIAQLISN